MFRIFNSLSLLCAGFAAAFNFGRVCNGTCNRRRSSRGTHIYNKPIIMILSIARPGEAK